MGQKTINTAKRLPVHFRAAFFVQERSLSIKIKASRKSDSFVRLFGRGRRIRTLGTRFWRPLLYQLSYAPMKNTHDAIFRIVGIVLELLSRFELLTSSLPRMRSTS